MSDKKLSFFEKIIDIQARVEVPKNQYNEFGQFNYRSGEDILAALSPLLKEHALMIFLSDEIVQVGERYYLKANVKLTDGKEFIEVSAFAREPLSKPKMDDSQVTGSASSYARKYALSGMFALDDESEDPDAKKNEVDEKLSSDKFTSQKSNLDGYVINYGKDLKGKTFKEAGKEEVKKLLNWFLEKEASKEMILDKGKKEFVDRAREYVR